MSIPLSSLWSKRSIVFEFAKMNIKTRYKGTKLGLLWTVLEPTLTFILLYVVFTTIRERTREDFAIYLLVGILIYHIFSRGTYGGLVSLRNNKNLLQSININKEFLLVSSTVATALLLLVEVAVLLGLLPVFEYIPPWTIVFFPLVLILLLVLIQGFTYFLAIANVYVKDIQPLWGIILHAAFFVTPIIWYLDDVDGILLVFHKINPIGQIVELGHSLIVFGEVPPLMDWAYSAVFVSVIFVVGFLVFKKYEDNVAEVL